MDHLPASKTVPTPLQGLGYVPGTPGRLSKSGVIHKYFRDVAAKSPRVKVFSIGPTDFGREMIVGVVSDEETIRHLDDYVAITNVGGAVAALINGRPRNGPPIPWKRTAQTPSLGEVDSTDDARDGMGIDGVAALRHFVERGGLLIVDGGMVQLPIQMQFTAGVMSAPPRGLVARGGIYNAQVVDPASPITYGYDYGAFPMFFSSTPLLQVGAPAEVADAGTEAVGGRGGRGGGRGGGAGGGGFGAEAAAPLTPPPGMTPGQARAVVRFHPVVDSLLVSGQLVNGGELAGKAPVVDAPLGQGHVIMFSARPYWRHQPQGSWALAINAMVHWNALSAASRAP